VNAMCALALGTMRYWCPEFLDLVSNTNTPQIARTACPEFSSRLQGAAAANTNTHAARQLQPTPIRTRRARARARTVLMALHQYRMADCSGDWCLSRACA
jgi:hypothetical protein